MTNETTQNQDVFPQVRIKSPVMEAWLNSLADIAVSLRLQKQLKIVDMEQDHAFVEQSGNLTMSTTVDGEPVRMVVPENMWSFCGN
jgi:predicted flavoprotein YhiN